MSVVHPAYHCGPNGGHGSFLPSASRRFSCVLVLATVASGGRAIPSALLPHHIDHISTASPSTGQRASRSAERGGGSIVTVGGMDVAYTLQDM